MDNNTEKQTSITLFMKKIAFPFTLANIIISAALFFMSTGIALTNASFKSYIIFFVFFVLHNAIIISLYLHGNIIMHTLFFSLVLFIYFYNLIPYIYLKNSTQLIKSNYVIIISSFLCVFSLVFYYIGYIMLFNNCDTPQKLPDCEMLLNLIKEGNTTQGLVTKYSILTLLFSFVGAFACVSIVLGCFGSSYFPNYLLFTNQDVCSRPTNQSFKCSMYQNGKIITASL